MNLCDVEFHNAISISDLNHLRKSAGWNELSFRQAGVGLNNSAYTVSATVNGSTVGMARVVSDGGYVYIIVDVIVLPQFQGKGIGREMMNRVMGFIRDSISSGECAVVNLMSAKGRETFYSQFGFIERPNVKFGAGMTQWISK